MTDNLIYLSYNVDGTFAGSPTVGIREYQHEYMEGPYIASFVFYAGEGTVADTGLRAWFDNKLMTQFATKYEGREVWRGYVWEMTLEMGGEIRIKSMEQMANATKCHYTNSSGDSTHTGWFLHDESIKRYGTKEKIVRISSSKTEEANERAAVELQYHASPFTSAIAYKETEQHKLTVHLVGRMVAANNMQLLADALRYFEPVTNENDPLYDIEYGDDITVSDEIRRIVKVAKYSGQWLYNVDITPNDTMTAAGVSSTVGVFDRLVELSKLRNTNGEHYRLQVRHDGGVIYNLLDTAPDYLRYPNPRGLETLGGNTPKWDARPGIIKYVDSFSGPALPDTQFKDKRLAFYERTSMKDGDDMATFHARDYDAADIYRAQEANQRWIETVKR